VIAVRARASIAAPLRITDLPDVDREVVAGPAVVAEPDCTVWVPPGWRAEPRALGAWVVQRI
jgi:N-methylhydantoinase A/oxoprolinase/acetone carboxylase beta subunit